MALIWKTLTGSDSDTAGANGARIYSVAVTNNGSVNVASQAICNSSGGSGASSLENRVDPVQMAAVLEASGAYFYPVGAGETIAVAQNSGSAVCTYVDL